MSSVKNLKDSLNDIDYGRDEDSTSGWITSYSDLVTLLLCFFIMFFAIFSKQNLEDIEDKKPLPVTIALTAEELKEKFANLKKAYSLVHQIPDIETVKTPTYFLIMFNDGNFFDPSSSVLNMSGQYKMALVLERLLPFSDKIFVDVQGHADPKEVLVDQKDFKSSLELSALRAISIFNYFKQFGFPEENMSISGLSNHRPIVDEEADEASILARNRRITFRVEAK